MTRRIAVVGDKLSSGGRVLLYQQDHSFKFHGRMTALIGDNAYCEECKSVGLIAKTGGPRCMHYNTNSQAAIDGDIVTAAALRHRASWRRSRPSRGIRMM